MPLLGLGVWQVPDGPSCVQAVRAALELGYRHIDTAQAYGNESSVGRALRESGIARDDVFITTKFHPGRRDPLREAAYSIEQLGVDYVDLYLVHWPAGGATWAWPGMEAARARSYARAIGVSNFDPDELDQVIAAATRRPGGRPGAVQPVGLPQGAPRRLRRTRRRDSRPTARWAPAHCWTTRWSRVSQTASGEAPPRSFCAGASNAASRSSPSQPIAIASPRTRRSSTSSSPADDMERARRARSIGRDPSGARAQMVVSSFGGRGHRAWSCDCLRRPAMTSRDEQALRGVRLC